MYYKKKDYTHLSTGCVANSRKNKRDEELKKKKRKKNILQYKGKYSLTFSSVSSLHKKNSSHAQLLLLQSVLDTDDAIFLLRLFPRIYFIFAFIIHILPLKKTFQTCTAQSHNRISRKKPYYSLAEQPILALILTLLNSLPPPVVLTVMNEGAAFEGLQYIKWKKSQESRLAGEQQRVVAYTLTLCIHDACNTLEYTRFLGSNAQHSFLCVK